MMKDMWIEILFLNHLQWIFNMKRYKFKDKLPPEGEDVFCYIPFGISKTSGEVHYTKEIGCFYNNILDTTIHAYTLKNAENIEWLDESEEITDTQRIDWLDANSTRIDYIAEEQDKTLIIEYNIREIIDKQIKEENENIQKN